MPTTQQLERNQQAEAGVRASKTANEIVAAKAAQNVPAQVVTTASGETVYRYQVAGGTLENSKPLNIPLQTNPNLPNYGSAPTQYNPNVIITQEQKIIPPGASYTPPAPTNEPIKTPISPITQAQALGFRNVVLPQQVTQPGYISETKFENFQPSFGGASQQTISSMGVQESAFKTNTPVTPIQSFSKERITATETQAALAQARQASMSRSLSEEFKLAMQKQEQKGNYLGAVPLGIGYAYTSFGEGAVEGSSNLILHPVKTAESSIRVFTNPSESFQGFLQAYGENPFKVAGSITAQTLILKGIGRIGGEVYKGYKADIAQRYVPQELSTGVTISKTIEFPETQSYSINGKTLLADTIDKSTGVTVYKIGNKLYVARTDAISGTAFLTEDNTITAGQGLIKIQRVSEEGTGIGRFRNLNADVRTLGSTTEEGTTTFSAVRVTGNKVNNNLFVIGKGITNVEEATTVNYGISFDVKGFEITPRDFFKSTTLKFVEQPNEYGGSTSLSITRDLSASSRAYGNFYNDLRSDIASNKVGVPNVEGGIEQLNIQKGTSVNLQSVAKDTVMRSIKQSFVRSEARTVGLQVTSFEKGFTPMRNIGAISANVGMNRLVEKGTAGTLFYTPQRQETGLGTSISTALDVSTKNIIIISPLERAYSTDKTLYKQIAGTEASSRRALGNITASDTAVRSVSDTALAQNTIQRSNTQQLFRINTPIMPMNIKSFNFNVLPSGTSKRKRAGLFDLLVRRRGKFRLAGSFESEESAIGAGVRTTSSNLSASFRVLDRFAGKLLNLAGREGSQYAPSKREGGVTAVQKAKYRLGSLGERQEIQQARRIGGLRL